MLCEDLRVCESESGFLSMHESLHVSKCVCVWVHGGVQYSMVCSGCVYYLCVCPVPLPAHQWVAGPSSLTKTSVFFQEDSHRKVGHTEILSSFIQDTKWKFTLMFVSEQIALTGSASKEMKRRRVTQCDVKARWTITEDLTYLLHQAPIISGAVNCQQSAEFCSGRWSRVTVIHIRASAAKSGLWLEQIVKSISN